MHGNEQKIMARLFSKTTAIFCIVLLGGGVGGYSLNGKETEDVPELKKQIEVNAKKIEKLDADITHLGAKIEDWRKHDVEEMRQLRESVDRLNDNLLRIVLEK